MCRRSGNPGPKYEDTRHNAGFWFVDELARAHGAVLRAENKFSGELARISTAHGDCWLLKPMTYMNHSGRGRGAVQLLQDSARQSDRRVRRARSGTLASCA